MIDTDLLADVVAGAYDAYIDLEFPDLLHPVYNSPRHQASWVHFELETVAPGQQLYGCLIDGQAAKKPGQAYKVRKYEIRPCDPAECPKEW